MSDEWLDDEDLEPPDRPDFRRVGRGIPYPLNLEGKRQRYGRCSGAGKILDDESNLTDWKLRTVVAGAAQRPELMAQAAVLDIDTDKKALRDIAEQCLVAGKGQRRAIIGDAVHAMFDHLDRGDDWKPPPNFNELCDAYEAMKDDWGLEPVVIEAHVINDEFNLAGRVDRIFRTTRTLVAPDGMVVPIASHIFGDHKTGKELEYASGSYTTQLAAYVDSVPYDVVNDERGTWDFEPVKNWALIIHADSSGTRVDVYWVDVEAGRLGLRLAQEVKAWRRRDDLLTIGRRLRTVPDVPEAVPEAPSEAPRSPVASREASRYSHLRGRVQTILALPGEPPKALQRAWPMGIAGLKTFNHSWEEMDAIERAIELVEKEYSLPFPPTWDDPQREESKAVHPSSLQKIINVKPTFPNNKQTLQAEIVKHPRAGLLRRWIGYAVEGGIDHSRDTTQLAHALFEFGMLKEDEWPDDDLTTMLDGSLRAMGYVKGVYDLGRFNPDDAPILMSAAFAIVAGNAFLLFDDEGNPIVRTNVKEAKYDART
jgi:hypothetical protein